MRHVLTIDEEKWLRENHQSLMLITMAERLKCDVVTVKRHLVRLGLRNYDAAKYCLSASSNIQYWERPCLICKDRKRRPRNQYVCNTCKSIDRGADDAYSLSTGRRK